MWGSKPEWGLDGRCGAYSSKSPPMKTGGGRLPATIGSQVPKIADNQNGYAFIVDDNLDILHVINEHLKAFGINGAFDDAIVVKTAGVQKVGRIASRINVKGEPSVYLPDVAERLPINPLPELKRIATTVMDAETELDKIKVLVMKAPTSTL